MLRAKYDLIGPVVLEKKIFKFSQHGFFLLFRNYLPLEKGMALELNKLKFPSPKDALCQFGWNWPSGFGEEYFKICQCIFAFS